MTARKPQIVVAYDFSESSELALQHSLNLGLESGERNFHFIVVVDSKKGLGLRPNETVNYQYTEEVQELATKHIEDALTKLDRGGEVSMIVHVRIGDPVKEILSVAKEVGASLIMLGSHGRKGVERVLLGSVSERVVREALCPVLVTRERTYADVNLSKIIEVPRDPTEFVPATRHHINTGVPTRPSAWVLY